MEGHPQNQSGQWLSVHINLTNAKLNRLFYFSSYQISNVKIINWTAVNAVAELGVMDISIGVNGEEEVSDLEG